MSFEFVGMNPPIYGTGAPIPNQAIQNNMYNQNNVIYNQQPVMNQPQYELPTITLEGSYGFTVVKDNDVPKNKIITVDDTPSNPEDAKKKAAAKQKKENLPAATTTSAIVRAGDQSQTLTGTVEPVPTAYSYIETTGLLRETLGQIDSLNSELMQEFESVRNSRTMKNKYNVLVGLSENVGSLISNRIATIKEINASISKSNDLDYKKLKDSKEAAAAVDDDKYIADLYKSFITNPQAQIQMQQMPMLDTSMYGTSGIVRADVNKSGSMMNNMSDPIYTNYIANASPEQRLMMYEGNNNIKQCMVYDASTGAKAFQYFDMSTMQPIPNMPVYSDILLEEFTVDLTNRKAKSVNMKETMDLIVINENITSQY